MATKTDNESLAAQTVYGGFMAFSTIQTGSPWVLTCFQPTWDDHKVFDDNPLLAESLHGGPMELDGYPRFGVEEKQWIASIKRYDSDDITLLPWTITGSTTLFVSAIAACITLLSF